MQIVLLVLMTVLNLCAVYTGVIALFTFKKRKPYPDAEPQTRFAVIIPARNEENVIRTLIDALNAQNYPREMTDVYVAVNHCTDRTAEIAESAGAKVLRCSDSVRSKGDVLHEVFEILMPMPYDAFAIFDADNIPDPDFLRRMNDALTAGERVCKGRLKGANPTRSWVAGGYALYHALMEWVYSRPHAAAGFSSNLVGTGFVAHREVIEKLGGWNTTTICEDTEFAAQTSRIGYRVAWVAEAVSLDEQVPYFGVSLKQRHRWCYGMIQSARKMGASMFSRSCPRKGMARDFGMLFLLSHTQPIAMLVMAAGLPFMPKEMLLLTGAGMLAAVPGMMLLALVLIRLGGYSFKGMLTTVLMFPFFMASWIPLQIWALFVPVKKWHPIPHGHRD